MIEHKRVAGTANESPSQIGGEDWDDDHLYGPGSVFLWGLMRGRWVWGAQEFTVINKTASITTVTVPDEVGELPRKSAEYVLQMAMASLPVREAATYVVHLVPMVTWLEYQTTSNAESLKLYSWTPGTGELIVRYSTLAANDPINFETDVEITLQIFVEVTG